MIVYDGTKSDFIKEVENGTIAAAIEKCVYENASMKKWADVLLIVNSVRGTTPCSICIKP